MLIRYAFQGFQLLVEGEWIEFGHKFADRAGVCSDDVNEKVLSLLAFFHMF